MNSQVNEQIDRLRNRQMIKGINKLTNKWTDKQPWKKSAVERRVKLSSYSLLKKQKHSYLQMLYFNKSESILFMIPKQSCFSQFFHLCTKQLLVLKIDDLYWNLSRNLYPHYNNLSDTCLSSNFKYNIELVNKSKCLQLFLKIFLSLQINLFWFMQDCFSKHIRE